MKIQKKITVREDKSLDKYFYEINNYHILSPEEEVNLFIRYKDTNDLKAREKLLNHNLKFVVSVAKNYQVNSAKISLIDLISAGNIGLLKAIEKFDHTKGFKFISYAVWWIKQNILDFMNKTSNQIFLPANIILTNKKVNKIKEKLFTETEINYDINDLFDMGLINDDEKRGFQIFSEINLPTSLDVQVSDENNMLYSDTISDQNLGINDIEFNIQQNKYLIKKLLTAANITDRERRILFLSFGINEERTYDIYQLGDIFDMTAERIRQIKKGALLKIKDKSKKMNWDLYDIL